MRQKEIYERKSVNVLAFVLQHIIKPHINILFYVKSKNHLGSKCKCSIFTSLQYTKYSIRTFTTHM